MSRKNVGTGVPPPPGVQGHQPCRRRGWLITSWQTEMPTDRLTASKDIIKYVIWQYEICPSTDRPHIQVYIEMKNPCSMDAMKRLFGDNTIHCKFITYGNRERCRDYHMKEETRDTSRADGGGPFEFEWGEWAVQGARNDIYKVRDAIDRGDHMTDIAREHFDVTCKYPRGVAMYKQLTVQIKGESIRPTLVHLYYGVSGGGKTRAAIKEARRAAGRNKVYVLEKSSETGSVWWDNYEGEEEIIMDDMYDWMHVNNLLRWLDIYPCKLPIKGGFSHLCAKNIWITSNMPVKDWVTPSGQRFQPEHVVAIMRRIHVIKHFAPDRKIYLEKNEPRTVIDEEDDTHSEKLVVLPGVRRPRDDDEGVNE